MPAVVRPARRRKVSIAGLVVVTCIAFLYRCATRELSLVEWLACRVFETNKFRSLFHPEHFVTQESETYEEAMRSRRAEVNSLMAMTPRLLQGEMAEVHDVDLRVKGGQIPLRVYIPPSSSGKSQEFKGVLLWMHGGGWIFGSVDASNDVAVDIAEASGMIVVNVGYRLAPEVKFPVPLMDCLAAVQWVKRHIWSFGGDRTRLALVGESSGGNLALATALRMSMSWIPFTAKKSELCAVVAASPAVSYEHAKRGLGEDDGEWQSYKRYFTGYGLEGGQMKAYWDNYLVNGKQGRNPLASPLRAPKYMLRGLPPVLLLRAEHEILWDEVSEMGLKIADAGQEVEEFQTKSCMHGTFAKGGKACGVSSLEEASRFLKRNCA